MDHIVVQVTRLGRLERIAHLAAYLTMEVDSYVGLAMATERYVDHQSDELFDQLDEVLSECKANYPNFHAARTELISLLIANKNLRGRPTDPPPTEPVSSSLPVEPKDPSTPLVSDPDQLQTGNIVNIFNSKVDK